MRFLVMEAGGHGGQGYVDKRCTLPRSLMAQSSALCTVRQKRCHLRDKPNGLFGTVFVW